jgi:hypothetical protein
MKLSRDEKIFLNRICIRLYGSPMKWRIMLNSGMSHKEVFKVLEEETINQRKIKQDAKDSIPK